MPASGTLNVFGDGISNVALRYDRRLRGGGRMFADDVGDGGGFSRTLAAAGGVAMHSVDAVFECRDGNKKTACDRRVCGDFGFGCLAFVAAPLLPVDSYFFRHDFSFQMGLWTTGGGGTFGRTIGAGSSSSVCSMPFT